MESFKIRINNEEESALIQQLMFKLDYLWMGGGYIDRVQFTTNPFLFFGSNKRITRLDSSTPENLRYFNQHENRELTMDQLLDEIEYELILKLKPGDKVSYIPCEDCVPSQYEKGVVKIPCKRGENQIRVVYHCNNEWAAYEEYTSQLTPISRIKIGWPNE